MKNIIIISLIFIALQACSYDQPQQNIVEVLKPEVTAVWKNDTLSLTIGNKNVLNLPVDSGKWKHDTTDSYEILGYRINFIFDRENYPDVVFQLIKANGEIETSQFLRIPEKEERHFQILEILE